MLTAFVSWGCGLAARNVNSKSTAGRFPTESGPIRSVLLTSFSGLHVEQLKRAIE